MENIPQPPKVSVKNIIVWVVIAVALLGAIYVIYLVVRPAPAPTPQPTSSPPSGPITQPYPAPGSSGVPEMIVVPPGTTPAPTAQTVIIQNFAFSPATVTGKAELTVTWTNRDSVAHTVTSGAPGSATAGKVFDSGTLQPGQSFRHTFATGGSFNYFCALHPYMRGNVRVE